MDGGTCEICRKRPATVRISRTQGGETRNLSICLVCAGERGLKRGPGGAFEINLPKLFPGAPLYRGTAPRRGIHLKSGPDDGRLCSSCGSSWADFKRTRRLGCAECYDAFREDLIPFIEKVQGSGRHRGLAPGKDAPKAEGRAGTAELKKRLREAVDAEEYEEAARLRDEIRAREGGK